MDHLELDLSARAKIRRPPHKDEVSYPSHCSAQATATPLPRGIGVAHLKLKPKLRKRKLAFVLMPGTLNIIYIYIYIHIYIYNTPLPASAAQSLRAALTQPTAAPNLRVAPCHADPSRLQVAGVYAAQNGLLLPTAQLQGLQRLPWRTVHYTILDHQINLKTSLFLTWSIYIQ